MQDYVAASLELSALVGYVSDEVAEAAGEDAVAAIEAAGTGPAADTVPASMGTSILAPTPAGFSPLDSAGTPEAPTSPGEQQSGTLNAWRSSDAAPSAVEESAAEVDAAADALKAADLSSSSPTAGAAASSKRGPGPVGGAAVKAGLHRSESTPAMHFTVGAPPDGAGLSSALALSVGFAKPDAFPTAHLGRDGAVTIGVGIWSGLTAPLVETRVEVGQPRKGASPHQSDWRGSWDPGRIYVVSTYVTASSGVPTFCGAGTQKKLIKVLASSKLLLFPSLYVMPQGGIRSAVRWEHHHGIECRWFLKTGRDKFRWMPCLPRSCWLLWATRPPMLCWSVWDPPCPSQSSGCLTQVPATTQMKEKPFFTLKPNFCFLLSFQKQGA